MAKGRLRTRTQRGLGPRPKTLRARVLERQVVKQAEPLFDWALRTGRWRDESGDQDVTLTRPTTRGECVDGVRPCPWVSCRHHLYLDVKDTGLVRHNFPGQELEQLKETCSLDVADAGRHTHEQVGDLVNMHRERVRQLEREVLYTVRMRHEEGEGDE